MLPCGEVHWKILPAISRELAVFMEKEGLAQSRIASALGTTSAAISQYMSGKRGRGEINAEAVEACRKLAKRIASNRVAADKIDIEISKILVIAKGSKLGKGDPCAICMGASHS